MPGIGSNTTTFTTKNVTKLTESFNDFFAPTIQVLIYIALNTVQ